MKPDTSTELIMLIGQPHTAERVQAALAALARGMQPELDLDDDESLVDWITVNEIGLELGFEDAAFVQALPAEQRLRGDLLLTQVYLYGDTADTKPFPAALPFGLAFTDNREHVRRKLAAFEASRRSFVRDVWTLPPLRLTAAYRAEDGSLQSLLFNLPPLPWPVAIEEIDVAAAWTPEALAALFGQRWSSAELRQALSPFDYDSALAEVRSEHSADLRMTHGIEFGFAPGRLVPLADPAFSESFCLSSVTFYGPRVYDAKQWQGPMPSGLSFEDSQLEMVKKIGRKPDEHEDFDQNGFALWHFEDFSLRVEYSNIENRLLRVSLLAPGYWARTTIGSAAND